MRPWITALFALLSVAALPSAAAPSFPAGGQTTTQVFLDKMTRLILSKGVDKAVSVDYVNALGLTPAGQDWPDHQIAADATDKTSHAFTISRGTDQDLVLYVRRTDGIFYVFRASRGGKSLAALTVNPQTHVITKRDADAVQKELDDEFAFWAHNVDKLLAGT
ncbi:MAG: hypothetical protein V4499_03995 [Pseudomonadota bacterium]